MATTAITITTVSRMKKKTPRKNQKPAESEVLRMSIGKRIKSGKRPAAHTPQVTESAFGENISFAAKEAYKLLRTNLSYILTENEEKDCHVIGVTSSLRGEGKSTTSVNLAYVLAEMNKRVILIEGDLRIPSLHTKLNMTPKNGLSDILVRSKSTYNTDNMYIQKIGDADKVSFDVIFAGGRPPNPSELIGSNRMEYLIKMLGEEYDYIVVDLPPVSAVTDALIAKKFVDGLIVVVRSDYADRNTLNDTLRQIQMVNGKVLGFVMTCANSSPSRYGKKYRYSYYKKDYK